jgi:glutamate synthase (ferredoxin)
LVDLERVVLDEDVKELKLMLKKHADYTESTVALKILSNWDETVPKFVKVFPKPYRRILTAFEEAKKEGLDGDDAWLEAFRRGVEAEA